MVNAQRDFYLFIYLFISLLFDIIASKLAQCCLNGTNVTKVRKRMSLIESRRPRAVIDRAKSRGSPSNLVLFGFALGLQCRTDTLQRFDEVTLIGD
jgi:hypothetical protein